MGNPWKISCWEFISLPYCHAVKVEAVLSINKSAEKINADLIAIK